MVVLDANLWVAAFDPADRFHQPSVAAFAEAARRKVIVAGPALVIVESVCALARRLDDPHLASVAGAKMLAYPALRLEPLADALLAEAARLGVQMRLRGADAIYVATAVRLGCPLLSWDAELLHRGHAQSPEAWAMPRPR